VKFEFFIGLRYLWNSRRNRFLSLISIISVLGIALGVAALISVISVMDGFQNQMKDKILGSNAHAHIRKMTGKFDDYQAVAEKVRKIKGVTGVTPSVTNEIMVSANQDILGGVANGIDIKTIGSVTDLPRQMEKGKLECLEDMSKCDLKNDAARGKNPEKDLFADFVGEDKKDLRPVAIGKEMAEFLSVHVGDILTVISPIGGGMGPTGPVPLSKNFKIVGIFYTGMYQYDFQFIYMSLKDAQDFFSMKESVNLLNVKVDDIYNVREITNRITSNLGGFPYSTQDWMDMHQNLFKALKLEKTVMFIILTFIILVASFNIVSTLIMLVMGKTREISILKAMGASNRSIMKIFMFDGFVLGSLGTILGMILAVIICYVLRGIEFPLAKDVYYMTTLPVELSWKTFAVVSVSSMIISFFATIYPSWQAAKIKPAEGLRYD